MPAVALEAKPSTGHGCFPPTPATGPYTTKSYFNGSKIQLKGKTKYAPHTCGIQTHKDSMRLVTGGSSTFFLEGSAVARIGDDIQCGDAVAGGSPSAFVG